MPDSDSNPGDPTPGSGQRQAAEADELRRADAWEADALKAIETVEDLAEAEALLAKVAAVEAGLRPNRQAGARKRRWAALKLRAERRWGELLPEPRRSGRPERSEERRNKRTGRSISDTERTAQNRARQVAAVPPAKFDRYVSQNPNPSRAGLLKKHGKRPEQRQHPSQRQREVEAEARGATRATQLWDLLSEVVKLTSVLYPIKIEDYDLDDPVDYELIEALHDDLAELESWMDRTIRVTGARLSEADRRSRISKVDPRNPENTKGRNEAEIENMKDKHAKLKRRLESEQEQRLGGGQD